MLTFFVLVNVFIAIIGDAFEDAKEASRQDTMVVRYYKMRLRKRQTEQAKTMAHIRKNIMLRFDSAEGDSDTHPESSKQVILNPEEIGEIEAELEAAGGEELQQWLTLKGEVDDEDGHLTRGEVEELFLLMDKKAENFRIEREEMEKYGEIALDPVHKKVIEVQTKLEKMEESQSARLQKIEMLLVKMTMNLGPGGAGGEGLGGATGPHSRRPSNNPSSVPSSPLLGSIHSAVKENEVQQLQQLQLHRGPLRNKSPSGKDLIVRLEPLPRPSTYLGVPHHEVVSAADKRRPLSAKRLPPSEVEQDHLDGD